LKTARYGERVRLAVVALLIVAFLSGSLPGGASGLAEAPAPQYISLGDSLALSIQPDADGHDGPTTQGFSEIVWQRRAASTPSLALVKLGRGGETAASMIKSTRPGPSQLELAELQLRGASASLVTIDVGANEVESCRDGSSFDQRCVARGLASLRESLPHIIQRLRAAGGPRLRIVGVNYYNSFLGQWVTGAAGHDLALASVPVERSINATLASVYRRAHVPLADVESRFRTRAFHTFVQTRRFGRIPLAVALTCRWTWACSSRYDDHTNASGYRVIARAVLAQLR
jgi:lysophospholipase L1-like esterase